MTHTDYIEDEVYGQRLLISISRRKAVFVTGMIVACYVVFDGEAVVVNASEQTRQQIMSTIEQLNPGAPSI